jgi:ligand-binding sensor domain-containing protein/signal transduction histidine kinase
MYRHVRIGITLSVALLSAHLFPAQASSYDAVPLATRFGRLDTQHGLSQATVTALAQDKAGYIWIGTQNGLNRYDGFEVKVFGPDSKKNSGLKDNFVTSLVVDDKGTIWVGTLKGLNRFNPQQAVFNSIGATPGHPTSDDAILALHIDQQNRLWAGTERGVALWHDETQSLLYWPDSAAVAPALQQQNITAIATDGDGHLWLGTPRGLVGFNIKTGEEKDSNTFPFQQDSVMALLFDKDGRLWVGLEHQGLIVREPGSQRWTTIPLATYDNGLASKEVRSIAMDSHGDIWAGTQHGLIELKIVQGHWQQASSYYPQRNNAASLGGGKVAAIIESQDNNIWIGTWNGGVSRLHHASNLFLSVTPDLELMAAARNPATITLAARAGALWAGTADGLFNLSLQKTSLIPVGDPLQSRTFFSSLTLGNNIFFGHTDGIKKLNATTGQYQDQPLPAAVPTGPVRRMWATAEHFWLGIDQFGIVILDRTLQQVIKQHEFRRTITFIRPLGQQFILVGSYDGLSWFDAKNGDLVYSHQLAASDGHMLRTLPAAPMAYAQTSDGRHWLASNGAGLYEMLHNGAITSPAAVSFKHYGEAQGLASGQLKAIELDDADNIWLSSDFGISVFMPQTAQFKNFGPRHGTLRRDYINAASTKFSDGTIVFGGMDGFTLFQPADVLPYKTFPVATPHIQAIQINGAALQINTLNKAASLAEALHNKHKLSVPATGSRSVSVEYSTREYIETNKVMFQYRLDPLMPDWVTQDANNRVANFDRLPPGSYQFRLRAGLPHGSWSGENQLSIEVLPLWWETWLARLLLVAIVLIALLLAHFIRLKQLGKRQEELARLVDERTETLNDRTRALEESKNKAEQTLQQLATTMQELVRTEKMAALGQLVAGVAHEVNTPLGVALTASSVVSEESRLLIQKLADGNIRRTELDNFLQKLSQATLLLDRNLHRAAQLVANFKQVSVDRTNDNQRQFKLALYLDELLESLSLMWKSRHVTISVNCPPDIVMDSYPGTIGQIITNFTQNAVIHAFKERSSGEINIKCTQQGNNVEIIFADNGAGIDSKLIDRIFDPFFTTNRHQGGTGLGLHIVYNLITQKLLGSITVTSQAGKGTKFIILLPVKISSQV